jgi:RNA polymerase sigma-70 factor (ECF subfamily)
MSDTLLINEFNSGDELAWSKIHEMFFDRICYFIYRIVGDSGLAEEITNDCFIKIFKLNKQFDTINGLKIFLFVIAKNAAFNELKRIKAKNNNLSAYSLIQEILADENQGMEREFEHAELLVDIMSEVERHPPKRKTVFKQLYFEGMDPKDIARINSIHLSRVYDYSSTLLKALRGKFGPKVDKFIHVLFIISTLLDIFV